MENVPVTGNVMVQDATPLVSFAAPQAPNTLPLAVIFTVPVAVLGDTVAVNFTAVLTFEGF